MNRKQLTLLIVLGIVLGGLGYLANRKHQSGYERGQNKEDGHTLLKSVARSAINDVAQITIKQGAGELNLTRAGELWTVKERGGYAANFNNISELLKKLWDVKVTRAIEAGPSRLPALKLTKETATQVELKDDKGKAIASLTLGMQAAAKGSDDDSPFGGPMPTGRYVMLNGDLKTLVLVADPLQSVETRAEEWLQKDFLKVENIRAVAVTAPETTNSWKVTRESAAGEWKLDGAKGEEKLDAAKIGPVNSVLGSASFNDVLVNFKPESVGLDKPRTATIQTFDGFTYALKLGKKDDEIYGLQFTVTADLPKERTPGKDEKPEDKTRLDKDFADNAKRLAEKLKADQALEKWTFTVSKWTVDPLLKDRKEWLAEKKEEPKKEDPKKEEKPEVK